MNNPYKRGICWADKCENKIDAHLEVSLNRKKVNEKWMIKACKEHFSKAWDSDYKKLIEQYVADTDLK